MNSRLSVTLSQPAHWRKTKSNHCSVLRPEPFVHQHIQKVDRFSLLSCGRREFTPSKTMISSLREGICCKKVTAQSTHGEKRLQQQKIYLMECPERNGREKSSRECPLQGPTGRACSPSSKTTESLKGIYSLPGTEQKVPFSPTQRCVNVSSAKTEMCIFLQKPLLSATEGVVVGIIEYTC